MRLSITICGRILIPYDILNIVLLLIRGIKMNHGSYRDTWVEISLDAVQHNVKKFLDYIHSETKFCAVVKADGYGHGAIEVAKAALEAGASYLAVAFLDEAIELRQAGIKAPILILGYTPRNAVKEAILNDIAITVFTRDVLDTIQCVAEESKKKARVHIKVDTGMSRIGVNNKEETLNLIQSITSDYVEVEGIFTHFADADNTDLTYTNKQYKKFSEVINFLGKHGINIPIKHCCNSAATIALPEWHMDMVRVGISLYGLYPAEHLEEKIDLTQVMSLKTKPIYIKEVAASQPISYGCTYAPSCTSLIATIPIGYADGFSRALSNKGHVTVKGKKVPIVGRVCMDQSMIDVTNVEDVNENDYVTIFGDPKKGYISLDEVAEQMNTIHYETTCLIGKRVPRIYIKTGK